MAGQACGNQLTPANRLASAWSSGRAEKKYHRFRWNPGGEQVTMEELGAGLKMEKEGHNVKLYSSGTIRHETSICLWKRRAYNDNVMNVRPTIIALLRYYYSDNITVVDEGKRINKNSTNPYVALFGSASLSRRSLKLIHGDFRSKTSTRSKPESLYT